MDTETQVSTERKIDAQTALEFALLIAFVTASGVDKGDTGKYKDMLVKTFTSFLDSSGYKIVPK